jgi:hypothetical protein
MDFWSFPCSPLLITNYWRGWTVCCCARHPAIYHFLGLLCAVVSSSSFTYLLVTHTPKFFIRRYYLLFLYITKSLSLERIQSNLSGFNIAPFLLLCLSMSLPLLLTLELSLPLLPCEKIERWKTDTDKAQRLFPPIFCVSYSFPLSDSPLVSSHRIYHRMEDQQQLAS